MLFLVVAGKRILVSEDKVDLVGRTALVRSEHDGERGLVWTVQLVSDRTGSPDREDKRLKKRTLSENSSPAI